MFEMLNFLLITSRGGERGGGVKGAGGRAVGGPTTVPGHDVPGVEMTVAQHEHWAADGVSLRGRRPGLAGP